MRVRPASDWLRVLHYDLEVSWLGTDLRGIEEGEAKTNSTVLISRAGPAAYPRRVVEPYDTYKMIHGSFHTSCS
jgi:hypothetical protein